MIPLARILAHSFRIMGSKETSPTELPQAYTHIVCLAPRLGSGPLFVRTPLPALLIRKAYLHRSRHSPQVLCRIARLRGPQKRATASSRGSPAASAWRELFAEVAVGHVGEAELKEPVPKPFNGVAINCS